MHKDARKILMTMSSYGCLTVQELDLLLQDVDVEETVHYLYRLKHLRIEPSHAIIHNLDSNSPIEVDTPLTLSIDGKIALEKEYERLRCHRMDEIRAWATLLIAFSALVVSIIALSQ